MVKDGEVGKKSTTEDVGKKVQDKGQSRFERVFRLKIWLCLHQVRRWKRIGWSQIQIWGMLR